MKKQVPTSFDKECLNSAIQAARESLKAGSFPVGATLAIDDKMLGTATDTGKESGVQINHAESTLIREYVNELVVDGEPQGVITIYSTLEHCLMCLGTAAMSKVHRIVFLQSDPHGGACGVDNSTLGERYKKRWPEIVKMNFSEELRLMICEFLQSQINNNVRDEWAQRMIKHFSC